MRIVVMAALAVSLSSAVLAQEGCGPSELEPIVKPMIASGSASGTAFRADVEDGVDPTAALIKVAPEASKPRFESCRVALEGVLEDLGFPPLH